MRVARDVATPTIQAQKGIDAPQQLGSFRNSGFQREPCQLAGVNCLRRLPPRGEVARQVPCPPLLG